MAHHPVAVTFTPIENQRAKTKGDLMRHGYLVIDLDTHVNPSWDVLSRYGDKDLLEHLDDLNAN